MKLGKTSHRTETCALSHDGSADEFPKFVLNDDENALCDENHVLIHNCEMPALQQ